MKQNPTRIILSIAFGEIRFHNGSVRCGVNLNSSPWPEAYFVHSVFKSKQFTFVVGENQTAITVHAAIIAKQSKELDVLINGSMREASDGKAIFEDIQEDTFIRFCQFAYTGDHYSRFHSHTDYRASGYFCWEPRQRSAVIRLQLAVFGLDVERLRSLRTWKVGSLTASI
jgi:hypothetical protein